MRPVMELRFPPVSEPAGWLQLPNCGLAPAGRSGVGSWESCLDILDQTGLQGNHLGALQRGVVQKKKKKNFVVLLWRLEWYRRR